MPENGWIVLDKPKGFSSNQALRKTARLLATKKAGYSGTLDPMATGILPLAYGEATKLLHYYEETDKEYVFAIKWGEATDTADAEGTVIATSKARPSRAAITKALPAFTGSITQTPPVYSAIKINGVRACDLARRGETPRLKQRVIAIYALEILFHSQERTTLKVHCSKGTYVRSLATDLATALGTYGHVTHLRRTRVGKINENSTISLEDLQNKTQESRRLLVKPLLHLLDDIPAVEVSMADKVKLSQGQAVRLEEAPSIQSAFFAVVCDGQLCAMATLQEDQLLPKRVFNLNE